MRIEKPNNKESSKVSEKRTIHNVFMIDRSGSMIGKRHNSAKTGILNIVNSIKSDNYNNNTVTVIEFWADNLLLGKVSPLVTNDLLFMTVPEFIDNINFSMPDGGTPLNDAIGKTITRLLSVVKEGEPVLINIFTDGEENSSVEFTANALSNLIKSVESKNFTVTFQGTEREIRYAIERLKLSPKNTIVHDNTDVGINMTFSKTVKARQVYSKSVSEGILKSDAFYKNSD